MSAVALAQDPMLVQDVEVPARRTRRRYPAAYKLKVLAEAAQCQKPGELGALLRREAHRRAGTAVGTRGSAGRTRRGVGATSKKVAQLLNHSFPSSDDVNAAR